MYVISALKATRLLNEEYEGYLASVIIEIEEPRPKLEEF